MEKETPEKRNNKFKAGGREYAVTLNEYKARQMLGIGFSVYEFFQDDESILILFNLNSRFSDLLLLAVDTEDHDTLLKGLDGDALDQAREAFKNEIVNFSPASQRSNVLEALQFTEAQIETIQATVSAAIG